MLGSQRGVRNEGALRKNGTWKPETLGLILGLSFLCCVTLDKSLNLSGLQYFSALTWKWWESLPPRFVVRFKKERTEEVPCAEFGS